MNSLSFLDLILIRDNNYYIPLLPLHNQPPIEVPHISKTVDHPFSPTAEGQKCLCHLFYILKIPSALKKKNHSFYQVQDDTAPIAVLKQMIESVCPV